MFNRDVTDFIKLVRLSRENVRRHQSLVNAPMCEILTQLKKDVNIFGRKCKDALDALNILEDFLSEISIENLKVHEHDYYKQRLEEFLLS